MTQKLNPMTFILILLQTCNIFPNRYPCLGISHNARPQKKRARKTGSRCLLIFTLTLLIYWRESSPWLVFTKKSVNVLFWQNLYLLKIDSIFIHFLLLVSVQGWGRAFGGFACPSAGWIQIQTFTFTSLVTSRVNQHTFKLNPIEKNRITFVYFNLNWTP